MGTAKSFVLRKFTPYLWFAAVGVFFAATYTFTQHVALPVSPKRSASGGKIPKAQATFSKTELYQVDAQGKPVLEMRSERIEMQGGEDEQKVQFVSIRGNFYEEGKPAMLFEGEKAFYDAEKKEVLFKNVHASSKAYGASFSGKEMLWQNKKSTLEITKSPVLKKGSLRVMANAIIAQPALKEVKAKGNVKMQEEKEQVTILADEQSFNFQTGEVVAKGNVRIQKEKLQVQADEAVYAQKKNTLTLKGGVVIVQEGSTLTCRNAKLYMDAQKAEADGAVKIVRGTLTVNAGKVDFSFKENLIVAQEDVQSVMTGEDKKETTLFSHKLEADMETGKIKATGNVTFQQGDIHLQSGFLSFEDKTGALLAKDEPKILMKDEKGNKTVLTAERMEGNLKGDAPYLNALNGVHLVREGSTVEAQEAQFLLKDEKVTFKGGVKLVQGENKIQGEQLVFSMKENKFKIIGNTKIQMIPQKQKEQKKSEQPPGNQ